MNAEQLLKCITDIESCGSLIDIDASDLDIVLRNGYVAVGVGEATGINRLADALKLAVNAPSLDIDLSAAKAVIVHFRADSQLEIKETYLLVEKVKNMVNPNCQVFFGIALEPNFYEKAKITIIAS